MARTNGKRGTRVLLAASGGGHLRQLLDLEPFWAPYDVVFVTEDTALGQSIAANRRTHFVAHVALGQARLGAPFLMLWRALLNLLVSFRIIARERPDVVLTTGAGSTYFTVLFARLFGSFVIIVDSFARFRAPSAFARIAGPLANVRISQAEAAARAWGTPLVFDPFRIDHALRPDKEPLVLATVGATLKFDRLVRMVDDARRRGLINERLIVQTGEGGLRPDGLNTVETLEYEALLDLLRRAEMVICHGGTGSLITALRQGCRVIAVPRRFDLGEHYDDHQLEISRALAERGLITVAEGQDDLPDAINRARHLEPRSATTDPSALINYLDSLVRARFSPAIGA